MIEDNSDIRDYYNKGVDIESGRLVRHQLERDITWRHFDEYLPPSCQILEIGTATGAHTVELARRGHQITAVDIAEDLIAECKKQAEEAKVGSNVQFSVSDARDLSAIEKSDFDAVLLMGPLYHLMAESERSLAVQQAYSRLKPGGLIFSSFISRFGILGLLMKRTPGWIEDREEVRSVIERGRDPEGKHKGGFRGYFTTLAEIAPLHEAAGFRTVKVAGVEPAISDDDESYNKLEGDQRRLWEDLMYEISGEESMIASSRHLLYIGEKGG